MKKIILYIAMSLDGYIAGENGELDWLDKFNDSKVFEKIDEFLMTIDTLIMGKGTYLKIVNDLAKDDWPYPGKRCLVLTSDLNIKDERIEVIHEFKKSYMESLKELGGKNIWLVGGGKTIEAFLEEDLIDEYQITVTPTILGKGIPLFRGEGKQNDLLLKNVELIGDLVTLTYLNK
ncbi:MAG: dihydrofolate reductase family protein [Clostridiaceae bacterium]